MSVAKYFVPIHAEEKFWISYYKYENGGVRFMPKYDGFLQFSVEFSNYKELKECSQLKEVSIEELALII